MAALIYTEYFTDRAEAVASALAAKNGDGAKAIVTGPTKKIRRPKAGGIEVVPNPDNKEWYVVVVSTAAELIEV